MTTHNRFIVRSDPKSSNSVSSLVFTLSVALLNFIIMVILFGILRLTERQLYMKRETYISRGLRSWWREMYMWVLDLQNLPKDHFLKNRSLDAFLLLRFIKLTARILLVGACITWPVLFPINLSGGGGESQLDSLTIANIGDSRPLSYYAHSLTAWVFVVYVLFAVTKEHDHYVGFLHKSVSLLRNVRDDSSKTVLFTSVPEKYLSVLEITTMFRPGKVSKVFFVPDLRALTSKTQEYQRKVEEMESVGVKVIMSSQHKQPADPLNWPTHRIRSISKVNVDFIRSSKEEFRDLIDDILELQSKSQNRLPCVFLVFREQADADAACFPGPIISLSKPLRYTGINRSQVIWQNLALKRLDRLLRASGAVAGILSMVLFWTIPIAAIGVITDIDFLIQTLPHAGFLNDVPMWIKGAISGFLPSTMISFLMSLAPVIIRWLVKQSGVPTIALLELSTQNMYFVFLVFQVLLVPVLSTTVFGIASTVVGEPESTAILLASCILRAGNFYVSYIILQGLAFSSGALLQVKNLVVGKIMGRLFDDTPRKIYNRWAAQELELGTIYPSLTLLAVIGIGYSCIVPLVTGLGAVGLYAFFFAYQYNIECVFKDATDTQGRGFLHALQHIIIGCYFLIICLIGIFTVSLAEHRAGVGPMILVVALLLVVILYHRFLNKRISSKYMSEFLQADGIASEILSDTNPKILQLYDPATEFLHRTVCLPSDKKGISARVLSEYSSFVTTENDCASINEKGHIALTSEIEIYVSGHPASLSERTID